MTTDRRDTTGAPTPARRVRRSDEETARRMLDVAVGAIHADGMSVGLDRIRLERVIAQAGVSRASAYRRWPTRESFVADVLLEVVHSTRLEPESDADIADLRALLATHHAGLHDPQVRRDVVVEALRRTTAADFRRILGSPTWRTYLALTATHQGLPDGHLRDVVGDALAQAEDRFTAHRAEVYAHLPGLIGYRLVAPLQGASGFRLMAEATGAMMTGLVVKAMARPRLATDTTTVAAFGSSHAAAWTAPEHHLVGVFLAHLEPDPEVTWDARRLAASYGLLEERVVALEAMRGAPVADASGRPEPGEDPS